MSHTIEPSNIEGILATSMRFSREMFLPAVGGFAVLHAPSTALDLTVGQPQGLEDLFSPVWLVGSLLSLLWFGLLAPWLQIAINVLVLQRYMARPLDLHEALACSRRLYAAYLKTSMFASLLVCLAALALVVPGVYLAGCWALIGGVVAVEGQSGMAALKRSRWLVDGYWWRVCGLFVGVAILQLAVAYALDPLLEALPGVKALVELLTQSVASALQAVLLMVLYVDLRCRKEGFDLVVDTTQPCASRAVPGPGPAG